MDNITHAFVGATLAEAALPRNAAPAMRRAFLCAGVAAASAPDIDLLYTGLAEYPIGYLLHHRGHSHTLPGLVVLGLAITGAARAWPRAWESIDDARGRWFAVLVAGLLSHLLMDAGNSYGTLLLYPFSSSWQYGDAVFVLEPWLWVLVGTTVAMNARTRPGRTAATTLMALPVLVVALIGLVTLPTLAALGAGACVAAWALRALRPRLRASLALAATLAIFVSMLGVSRTARAHVVRQLPAGRTVVDVVLDPNPAVPWCWSVLTLEQQHGDTFVARRGTLSLLPSVRPVETCATSRLMQAAAESSGDAGGRSGAGNEVVASSRAMTWHRSWTIDAAALRARYQADCRVGAWLAFVRVPHLSDISAVDLRYENPLRMNFSTLTLDRVGAGCPSLVPAWTPPRRDILEPARPH